MKMEVEIISKECIKPSSSTPLHPKTHKLSFMDQHAGHGYIPLVFYYPVNSENISTSERLQLLKQSLSETLSVFYPFAGKIKDSCSIDCNDEGVYFVQARIKIPLNEFLHCPIISWLKKFLPDEANWKSVPGDYVAGVQVTAFSCGGIALGVYVSHRIADGVAFSSFLKGWAATANKITDQEQEAIHPKFDGSSIFTINDAEPGEASSMEHVTNSLVMKLGKYITKRYVFEASAIAKLKAKAISSGVQNPTRVEVVSAVFAKSIRASLKARSDKPFLLNFGVNLRRRAIPQFSESYMGNFPWMASVECKEDKDVELKAFVCHLKEEISKLNAEFVNSLQGDEGWFNYLKALQHEREIFTNPGDLLFISSWCNFGIYNVDFGWGKPVWVSDIDIAERCFLVGAISFMDTRHKDGIEAWAGLLEEDVSNLEQDEEFLSLATMDLSPLKFQGSLINK